MDERVLQQKVVPLRQDAEFFFQRGVQFLNRSDLPRALRSFRRAVECEPLNAVNHCNLAGVLSELGDFEESNQILQNVLNDIAPDMAECYFYMANNYANLGEYELAEAQVVKYLEVDPTGEFAGDADEMLDLLIHEFGGGEILRASRKRQIENTRSKDRPRSLLEEGKFHEAVHVLEQELAKDEQAIAPRNNLSLAKYYLGHIDEATEYAHQVLEIDPTNIHALCNLAVFARYRGKEQDEYKQLVGLLKKIHPLQFDHGFKLATTLGILGEHKAAYQIFLQLIEFGDRHDPTLYFALAVADVNLNRFKQAKQWLLEVQALDPDSGIAAYYLQEVEQSIINNSPIFLSYSYQLPFHLRTQESVPAQNKSRFTKAGAWMSDPGVRSSLYFALMRGYRQTKREALQAFSILRDEETRHVLREFVQDHRQAEDLIWNALFVLQLFPESGFIQVWVKDQLVTLHLPLRDDRLFSWDTTLYAIYQTVKERLTAQEPELIDLVYEIWMRFLQNSFSEPPKIIKRNVWAAALEYVVRRTAGRTEPQAVLSKTYEVSTKALAKAAHAIMLSQ